MINHIKFVCLEEIKKEFDQNHLLYLKINLTIK